MRRLLILAGAVFSIPAMSWGWMGFGGGIDYSRDAGNSYYCASTGTVTTQAGVSISSPVFSLFNPSNSGKNLVVLDVGVNVMASPAAAALFSLAYNVTPSSGVGVNTGASGNMTSALVGKSTSTATTSAKGVCNLQGILPATPIIFRDLGGTTGASAISGVVLTDATQGKIVIPPGGLVSFQSSSAANVQAHVSWREDNL